MSEYKGEYSLSRGYLVDLNVFPDGTAMPLTADSTPLLSPLPCFSEPGVAIIIDSLPAAWQCCTAVKEEAVAPNALVKPARHSTSPLLIITQCLYELSRPLEERSDFDGTRFSSTSEMRLASITSAGRGVAVIAAGCTSLLFQLTCVLSLPLSLEAPRAAGFLFYSR